MRAVAPTRRRQHPKLKIDMLGGFGECHGGAGGGAAGGGGSSSMQTAADRRVLGEDLTTHELERLRAAVMKCTEACRSPPLQPPAAQNSGSGSVQLNTNGLPSFRSAHVSPPILVCDEFLDRGECDALIASGEPRLQPSAVSTADPSLFRVAPGGPRRTSASAVLHADDATACALLKKIATLTGHTFDDGHLESVQIARYNPGEEYSEHTDAVELSASEPSLGFMARGGQRVATVLVYLSDVESGGETDFPRLGYRCTPRAGRCLVFFPALADGSCDERLLHAARPAAHTKWVAQVWVRQFPDPLRSLDPPRWPSGCRTGTDLYRLAATGGEEQALMMYYFRTMA